MRKLTFLLLFIACSVGMKADVVWDVWSGTASQQVTYVSIPKDIAKTLEVGDKIQTTFELKEGQTWPSLKVQIDWKTIVTWVDGIGETGTSTSYTVTSDLLSYINGESEFSYYYWDGTNNDWGTTTTTDNTGRGGDFQFTGDNVYFTSVKIIKKHSFIKKDLGVSPFSMGNWNGTNVSCEGFAYAAAGDFVYAEATQDLDNTPGDSQYWQFYYGATKAEGDSKGQTTGVIGSGWFPITADQIDYFKNYGGWFSGRYLNITGLYLYQPVSSFTIGSIGLATFSANQEVTVPEGLTAYRATVSGNTVTLSKFTDNVIPARTGAIVKGAPGTVVEFVASATGSSENSSMIPVLSATAVCDLGSDNDHYVLYNSKNAKVGDDLKSYFGIWSDHGTYSDGDVNFTVAWGGASYWLGNVDYSDYSRIVIEFSSAPTQTAALAVSYVIGDDDYVTIGAGETSATLELDYARKGAVKQIAIRNWCGETSNNMTISSIKLYGDKAEFRKTTSGTIAANKAYLDIPGGQSAKLSVVFDDNGTTGISDVTLKDDGQRGTGNVVATVYNLSGQRVSNAYKGVVIVNGKKVIR